MVMTKTTTTTKMMMMMRLVAFDVTVNNTLLLANLVFGRPGCIADVQIL